MQTLKEGPCVSLHNHNEITLVESEPLALVFPGRTTFVNVVKNFKHPLEGEGPAR